jgi:biotin carboxyl carrier protein
VSHDDRSERERTARRDREAIERLADEVLPSLIARFGASDLGELEVKRGAWRIRLRRPLEAGVAAGSGPAPASVGKGGEGKRPGRAGHVSAGHVSAGHVSAGHSGSASGNGQAAPLAAVGPGRPVEPQASGRPEPARLASISPGVGYFTAREGIAAGTTVRGGDVLGHVDVLGVRQEVVAPADGIVARVMAEQGEAVEYGQELVRLDPAPRAEPAREG